MLGVLAGVSAGALLGILFAPDKGKVTREKISHTGEDYAESMKKKFNNFRDNITEKFDKVKEEVADYAKKHKAETEF